jgi:hypothetical protein
MEKSAQIQQSGTCIHLVEIVAKEGGNISGNGNFQIPTNRVLNVNDLDNAYLKFDVEREYVFTTDTQLAQATTIFLRDKHTAGFFN